MFRRLGAGSGAPWRPWYDGGRHGDRELARLRCVVVFCVSIVRKLLPRGKTAREQFLPPVASVECGREAKVFGGRRPGRGRAA
jgi:hypothetical protein